MPLKQFISTLVGSFLVTGCMSLFYYPDQHQYIEASAIPVEVESFNFPSGDGTSLHAWHLKGMHAKSKGLVLQLHGNAQNLSAHFYSLAWLLEQGFDLLSFDYRGYGQSAGSPSPLGLRQDALAALQEAAKRAGGRPLVAWGQSLGGAVLLDALAASPEVQRALDRVVIESSFVSYRRISQAVLARHWFTWPLQPLTYVLINDDVSAVEKLNLVERPTLVIHGDQDTIVPFSEGRALFSQLSAPKQFMHVVGGEHLNSTHIDEGAYRQPILNFLQTPAQP